IVRASLALDEERLVEVGLVVGVDVGGPHRVAPEHHVAVVMLVHAQRELRVHGLCVKAAGLGERVVGEGLRDAVIHHDEEADLLECPAKLAGRGGERPGPSGQVRTHVDHRDHDDEIAPSAGFDNEAGGRYGRPQRRCAMVQGKFKVLDSDIHIIEPPDLWPRYIDPAFRDQAPIGLTEDEGDLRLAHNRKAWGRVAGVDADRNRRRQGKNYALNQQRWKPYAERGWTSKVQLEAMDIEGIDVAVVYPSRGLFALTIPDMEPRLAAAIARAYNDWLHDFCQENPAPSRRSGFSWQKSWSQS